MMPAWQRIADKPAGPVPRVGRRGPSRVRGARMAQRHRARGLPSRPRPRPAAPSTSPTSCCCAERTSTRRSPTWRPGAWCRPGGRSRASTSTCRRTGHRSATRLIQRGCARRRCRCTTARGRRSTTSTARHPSPTDCSGPDHATADILIIGAGPAGLFATYYAGMRGLSCVLVDSLPHLGRTGRGALSGEARLRRRGIPGRHAGATSSRGSPSRP